MEIDITAFVQSAETHELSGSVAELGQNAGKITWANSCQEAESTQFIQSDKRDAFESWVRDFGAWTEEEIQAWSLTECNALLIQYISGDLNELESLCYSNTDEFGIDWAKAERLAHDGVVSGNLFRSGDRVYFYMGN